MGDAERLNYIVSLREKGETYNSIGKRVGVTGERIRQLLKRSDRVDLTGSKYRHVDWSCMVCGQERRLTPSKAHLYSTCSNKCWGRVYSTRLALRPKSVARAIAAMDQRACGGSWVDATAATDLAGSSNPARVFYFLSLWAKAIDVDVTWAYCDPASPAPSDWRVEALGKVEVASRRYQSYQNAMSRMPC